MKDETQRPVDVGFHASTQPTEEAEAEGEFYQFVHIRRGNPPTYQLMPFLTLMEAEPSILLLQVLKAICKLSAMRIK
ncbi:hypothetical protein [Microcoleus sp. AT8-B4]|uniref:hypothetical protein n=1 Tax=Microcoleus sp. AT8-B4 TaxID=2818620 RepID=UPI004040C926